jgi:hypothetical protein
MCNLTQTDAIMGSVNQSFEISEHITLERGLAIIDKTSLNCANLIKEYNASNNGITTFNLNKVSTLVNKDILD